MRRLGSLWMTVSLLLLVAGVCAVATFVENDFGTQSAKSMIYNSHWFAALLFLLALNLLAVAYRFRMWNPKKLGSFLFHASFIVILLGALMTRYLGYEGTMHIREGESADSMLSAESYLQLELINRATGEKTEWERAFLFSATDPNFNRFSIPLRVGDQEVLIGYAGFEAPANAQELLTITASHQDQAKMMNLSGGTGMKGQPGYETFGPLELKAEWGGKVIPLPFAIKLRDFDLDRYPGSMMPSGYASEITVLPQSGNSFDFRIFMNHVLDHGGYRFFQSSYDPDEQGTVLSINNDPGKWPTYIGYFMLSLGFILNFFTPKSRFSQLARYAKASAGALILTILISTPDANAFSLEQYGKESKDFAKQFGRLLVQDSGGRIKPVDTLAREVMLKVVRTESWEGLDANQMLLGMLFYPEQWQQLPLVKVSTPQLQRQLGLSENQKRASFSQAFPNDQYLLAESLQSTHLKKQAQHGKYDKDLIKVDERLNILYAAFQGNLLKIFPLPGGHMNNRWLSPLQAFSGLPEPYAGDVKTMVKDLMVGLQQGVQDGQWERATWAVQAIDSYQREHGASVLPSDFRRNLEVLYNGWQIFLFTGLYYLIMGIGLFVVVLGGILQQKPWNGKLFALFATLMGAGIVAHSFGMGVRWVISGHAPWSDAYESMVYIAWAASFGGILFFRRFPVALSMSAIMAGTTLSVAHLGFMDPQITNLVPVLKSYWLNIHVSVITASYGFLGLSCLMGLTTLLLFLLRRPRRRQVDDSIHQISAINEMSVIIGLALLTIGNFLGGVWANESWGRYWGWDPKETWSLISILIYAAILHLRLISKFNAPYVFAVATTVGFASILMTYFGVNFYLSGMHSYASGDPVPIPAFVYWMSACVAALITLAWFRRDLGPIPLKDSRSS